MKIKREKRGKKMFDREKDENSDRKRVGKKKQREGEGEKVVDMKKATNSPLCK